jgi:hypothetical protein
MADARLEALADDARDLRSVHPGSQVPDRPVVDVSPAQLDPELDEFTLDL